MKPSMLDHALALARSGHEVFPLAGKVPAIEGGHGCWDASYDPQVVRGMWASRPFANIGIHVADGELVLDIDPRKGGDVTLAGLQAAHGALPATRTALTGRGDGGLHLTFQHPGGAITGRALVGIDLKQRGGYVVAPPSVHPDTGGRYQWLDTRAPAVPPVWLVQLMRPVPVVPPPGRLIQGLPGQQLVGLVRFVAESSEGERNDRLFWASCRGHELVIAGRYPAATIREVFQSVGEAIGLTSREVSATIASAFTRTRRAS